MQISISTLSIASFASAVALMAQTPVQAATVTSDFTINNLDGVLAGNTFTGSFSYDDSSLTSVGDEFISLSSVLFDFQGTQYTESDDPFAEAEFFDGEFLGINFSFGDAGTDPITFTFIPGFSGINDAFFTYDFTGGIGGAGTGDIIYATTPAPIPTPAMLPGLIGMGVASMRKRKLAADKAV